MSQGGDYTDRSFVSGLQSLEGVGGGADEGIHRFIVLQNAHEGSIADGAHEILSHICSVEKVYHLSVLQPGAYSEMSMFAGTRYAFHRLSFESRAEPKEIEHVSYDVFYQLFIVCSLERRSVLPVDLQLFHYVVHTAGRSEFGFDSSDFLMSHFHSDAVTIEDFYGLFKGGSYRTVSPLPVLLFKFL